MADQADLYDVYSLDPDTNEWSRAGRSLAQFGAEELAARIRLNDVECQLVAAGDEPKRKRGQKVAASDGAEVSSSASDDA